MTAHLFPEGEEPAGSEREREVVGRAPDEGKTDSRSIEQIGKLRDEILDRADRGREGDDLRELMRARPLGEAGRGVVGLQQRGGHW